MLSSDPISLALVMVLALLLKYAVLYILLRSPVFGLDVSFSNVTSSVSMNLYPFMVFNRFFRCDSTNALVFNGNGSTDSSCLESPPDATSHAP